MKSGLTFKVSAAVVGALLAGLLTCIYGLFKFSSYEDGISKVVSGDQKSILIGQMIEVRLKGAQELVGLDNDFKESISAILEDAKTLSRLGSDSSIEGVRSGLQKLLNSGIELQPLKTSGQEDLFVAHRNLKTAAFQLYRFAWTNKWMNVAHSIGLVINDLDNIPYHSAEKAVSNTYTKIINLSTYVNKVALSQAAKLTLLGQLGGIKAQIIKYNELIARAEKIRTFRLEEVKSLITNIHKYNERQGKGIQQFAQSAHTEFFKFIMAFFIFLLFAIGWYLVVTKRFAVHINKIAESITKEFGNWMSPSGTIYLNGFNKQEPIDAEFSQMYRTFDEVIRQVNTLRKEDVLIKRLLNVPFLLINSTRHAIFWNSALSILGKTRTLEEQGPISYTTILRFVDRWGKRLDPVEKCFEEKREITQLALFKVSEDSIAVHITCTPVFAPDHTIEYVMVHFRDLREENRRLDREVESQLDSVKRAIQAIRMSQTPEESKSATSRKAVEEILDLLRDFALEQNQKSEVVSGQINLVSRRMERETSLKKLVYGRMQQFQTELNHLRENIQKIQITTSALMKRAQHLEERSRHLRYGYTEIQKRGQIFFGNFRSSQELLSQCFAELESMSNMAKNVRDHEDNLKTSIQSASIINANNSIFSARKEFTPVDVMQICDGAAQIIRQFERSKNFVELSTQEMEKSIQKLVDALKGSLARAQDLLSNDRGMAEIIGDASELVDTSAKEMHDLTRELRKIESSSTRISSDFRLLEAKSRRLIQIGSASLQLQDQLEQGFRGIQLELNGQSNNKAAVFK